MDIEKLRTFCALIEHKTLQEASKVRQLTVSGVHRQITSLEAEVGKKLFEKQQKWLKPTQEADTFYGYCLDIIKKYDNALAQLKHDSHDFSGQLTINAPTSALDSWLMEDLSGFIHKHPDIHFTLIGDNGPIEKSLNEADVFIRSEPMSSFSWDSLPLRDFTFNLYASTDYLAQKGQPLTPDDLKNHRIIFQGSQAKPLHTDLNWHLQYLPTGYRNILTVSTGLGVYMAVKNSIGIGSISAEAIRKDAQLIQCVLPQLQSFTRTAYLSYAKDSTKTALVTKLYDYMRVRRA